MHAIASLGETIEASPATSRSDSHGVPSISDLESAWSPNGWLSFAGPYSGCDSQQRLTCHADWRGPQKLICVDGQLKRLVEVYVSHDVFADQLFDADFAQQREDLLGELCESVFADRSPRNQDCWPCPPPEKLAEWLTEVGFQPAIDGDGDLRLTLKARGRDGQVRVQRQPSSLRMTMRIGTWTDIDEVREAAMLRLAEQTNDRGRLARVVWMRDGSSCHCDAQVDLTGLPTAEPAERLWPDMLAMSMHGLALALRRAVIELDVLADGANRELAAQWTGWKLEEAGALPVTDS